MPFSHGNRHQLLYNSTFLFAREICTLSARLSHSSSIFSLCFAIVLFASGPLLADAQQDLEQGLRAYAQGNYERAVEDFSRALTAPGLSRKAGANAFVNRGAAFIKLQRYQNAVDDYTRALELKPGSAQALTGRAVAYMRLGKLDLAISDNTTVVAANPKNKMALNNRGTAYLLRGYLFEAIEDFDRVISLEARGDYEGDISDFGQTKSVDPNFGIAHFNRANAYMRWGQIEIATSALNEFIWQHPENHNGWFLRCRCRAELSPFGDILADCRRALRLSPESAEVRAFMGFVHERDGRYKAAVEEYREALRVDPALPDAREGLARLNADL